MLTDMLRYLHRQWGWIALRGALAVLFGVFAILRPGMTLAALVITWGAYSAGDGILALVAAWQVRRDGRHFWSLLAVGLLGIAAGAVTLVWPAITAVVLLVMIAAWAPATGLFQVLAAIRLRKEIEGEWALGLSGALSILFGLLMFMRPGAGALAMLWMIAGYAVAFGALLIVLGFRVRSYTGRQLAPA
jgi:uncharacterized membrane protein HdeD (DUF308 family)